MNLPISLQSELPGGRHCLRDAIPEIAVAAKYLNDAVSAHFSGKTEEANKLIKLANMLLIRDWVESIWGKKSAYLLYRKVIDKPFLVEGREKLRMPSADEKRLLHLRDGYHCRFCGIPVIRAEVRNYLRKIYPEALPWGRLNATQHAAFQAMWAQYDHLLPHARGGKNEIENIVVTCAPCNYGRMDHDLEEVGLADPRTREPIQSTWDGLERVFHFPSKKTLQAKPPS